MVGKKLYLIIACLVTGTLSGCTDGKLDIKGAVDTATWTKTALLDECKSSPDIVMASSDANKLIRLKSSEESTSFYVDNKIVGNPAKLLKVCINDKIEHIIEARPAGCTKKIEKLSPPYNNAFYEFQFMVHECQQTTSQQNNSTNHPPHRKRRN